MTKSAVRLSRKAQDAAGNIAASFDQAVREHASLLAESQGKEFADEADVQEGFRLVLLKYAEKVGSAVQVHSQERSTDGR